MTAGKTTLFAYVIIDRYISAMKQEKSIYQQIWEEDNPGKPMRYTPPPVTAPIVRDPEGVKDRVREYERVRYLRRQDDLKEARKEKKALKEKHRAEMSELKKNQAYQKAYYKDRNGTIWFTQETLDNINKQP